MGTFSVWARQDSITANNATLNPIGTNQAPTTQLTFTDNNGAGDLNIEYNGGLPDPDTRVIINGTPYNFTVVLSGILPSNSQVPASFQGRTVLLLRVTVGGTLREYFYVVDQPPATFAQMNAIGSGAIPLQNVNTAPPPYCFCIGTEISTPSGRRRVETLRAGDSVLTEDGRAVTIAWIGTSCYSGNEACASSALRPVHIRAHAFGPGCPDRELVVSPQHRIVAQGAACELLFGHSKVFVTARHLIGTLASAPEPEDDVVYYHILLENHDILVSNGLSTESFQPARRMVEAMDPAARASLEAVLDVLGRDAMLTRTDALQTLTHRETLVLLGALAEEMPPVGVSSASLRRAMV